MNNQLDPFYIQTYWLTQMTPMQRSAIGQLVKADNGGKYFKSDIKNLRACHKKAGEIYNAEIYAYQLAEIKADEEFEKSLTPKN